MRAESHDGETKSANSMDAIRKETFGTDIGQNSCSDSSKWSTASRVNGGCRGSRIWQKGRDGSRRPRGDVVPLVRSSGQVSYETSRVTRRHAGVAPHGPHEVRMAAKPQRMREGLDGRLLRSHAFEHLERQANTKLIAILVHGMARRLAEHSAEMIG